MANIAGKLGLTNEIREVKIGNSFGGSGNPSFHTIRYDFKPASLNTKQIAAVDIGEGNQVTVTIPHTAGSGTAQAVFKGSKKPHEKECVLIIDNNTGEITLEKLSSLMQVKKTRGEGNSKNRNVTPLDSVRSKKVPPNKKRSAKKPLCSPANQQSSVPECSPLSVNPVNLTGSLGSVKQTNTSTPWPYNFFVTPQEANTNSVAIGENIERMGQPEVNSKNSFITPVDSVRRKESPPNKKRSAQKKLCSPANQHSPAVPECSPLSANPLDVIGSLGPVNQKSASMPLLVSTPNNDLKLSVVTTQAANANSVPIAENTVSHLDLVGSLGPVNQKSASMPLLVSTPNNDLKLSVVTTQAANANSVPISENTVSHLDLVGSLGPVNQKSASMPLLVSTPNNDLKLSVVTTQAANANSVPIAENTVSHLDLVGSLGPVNQKSASMPLLMSTPNNDLKLSVVTTQAANANSVPIAENTVSHLDLVGSLGPVNQKSASMPWPVSPIPNNDRKHSVVTPQEANVNSMHVGKNIVSPLNLTGSLGLINQTSASIPCLVPPASNNDPEHSVITPQEANANCVPTGENIERTEEPDVGVLSNSESSDSSSSSVSSSGDESSDSESEEETSKKPAVPQVPLFSSTTANPSSASCEPPSTDELPSRPRFSELFEDLQLSDSDSDGICF